jgi:hypothetical protein
MRVPAWRGLVVLIILAVVIGIIGYATSRPNYRRVTLADGTVLLAELQGTFSRTPRFYSVRSEDTSPGAPLRTAASLHFRGREFRLRELSSAELQAVGIGVDSALINGEKLASLGFGEQNRDGALEFYFNDGRLRAFYARCHVADGCGYALSWPSRRRFSLPVEDPELEELFESVVSVKDEWGK